MINITYDSLKRFEYSNLPIIIFHFYVFWFDVLSTRRTNLCQIYAERDAEKYNEPDERHS